MSKEKDAYRLVGCSGRLVPEAMMTGASGLDANKNVELSIDGRLFEFVVVPIPGRNAAFFSGSDILSTVRLKQS
jgi:hypothetical protein